MPEALRAVKATISPVLRYEDAASAVDWLIRAFGFHVRFEVAEPDGTISHAELAFGASGITVGARRDPNAPAVGPAASANPWDAVREGLYVYVDEVEPHYTQARQAGADIAMPLANTEYGSREYSARDSEGHLWSFGTYVSSPLSFDPPTIIPALRYRNGPAAIDFLARAFGFDRHIVVPGPADTIAHAEMTIGSAMIMLGSGQHGHEEGIWSESTQGTYVIVEDVDDHYAQAELAGAEIVTPPADTDYGARLYSAFDLEHHLWSFGTYRPLESRQSSVDSRQ